MNLEGIDNKDIDMTKLTIADKWILNKLNETAKEVNENIKNYRIGEVAHILYDFFWNSYCDWYVEIAKIQLSDDTQKANTQRVLRHVLDMSLRLLHPIMPHITERVWQLMPKSADEKASAIIVADYPVFNQKFAFEKEAKEMELVFETIKSLRNVRQSFNISPSIKVDAIIDADSSEIDTFKEIEAYIHRLAKVENISYDAQKAPKKSASAVVWASKIIVPLEDLIDVDSEVARQNKKLEKLSAEKNSLAGRMKNEKFVANAPKELIEQTTARIEELELQETTIKELIEMLKS